MKRPGLWIFALLCLLALLASGQAVICYVCNSYFDEACHNVGTDNATGFLRDCDTEPIYQNHTEVPEKYTICRKMTFQLPKEPKERIIRTCSWIKYKSSCYFTATKDLKSSVCQCTEPGCNDSSSLKGSWVTLAALLLPLYLMCQNINNLLNSR